MTKSSTNLGYHTISSPSVRVVAHPSGHGFAVMHSNTLGDHYDVDNASIAEMLLGPRQVSSWPSADLARAAIESERSTCADIATTHNERIIR